MVGERRNGNLLVQLSPHLQAFPEELIRQRRTYDGQTEYLIRWCLINTGERSGVAVRDAIGAEGACSRNGGSTSSASGDAKQENILMWMTAEDVYANCPTLLGKRKLDSQRPLQENLHLNEASAGDGGQRSLEEIASDVTFDEVELLDMKEDVKNLVLRARRQMAKTSEFSISIMHTIHVLSAYASIGSLVGVFKETGALNLLMELLCNKETQTRRSASKMLRALASHDAGSRAYVLLSLSQQDGIEQHMDFDNRYTLLELFAETTSSEEHGISFEGIHLPQIPGKLLFSLVKRYLCVTSLMDLLNSAGTEPCSDRQDVGVSTAVPPSSGAPHSERLYMEREFEFTMAMANLISELVRVMGWDRNRQAPTMAGAVVDAECQDDSGSRPVVRSIFQPRFGTVALTKAGDSSANAAPLLKKNSGNVYKRRPDFSSRSSYVEYVQDHLKSGMAVRMLEDYEEVSNGDVGEFRYSNDGSPPVQVYWRSLGRTYWVHWHMVEILDGDGNSQGEKETQEKASTLAETIKMITVSSSFFAKPPGGLYSLPYLREDPPTTAAVSRAEWWEVLYFIKKLEANQQEAANVLLRQSLEEQPCTLSIVHQYNAPELDNTTLLSLSVSGSVVWNLLHFLKQKLPPTCLSDLLCSYTFSKFYLQEQRGEPVHLDMSGPADSTGVDSQGSSSALSTMGSVCKKAKKELPVNSSCNSLEEKEEEGEIPIVDTGSLPDNLEDKMKVYSVAQTQGRKTVLERMGMVVDILRKSWTTAEHDQQLAAVLVLTKILEDKSQSDKNFGRSDLSQAVRDKVVKLLVELLASSSRSLLLSTLTLTQQLMLRYDWRLGFATEGGVKAVLACMQEQPADAQVQQQGLEALRVITGASKHDLRCVDSLPLSEPDSQMMLEIFASIGSATPQGTHSLLAAIPAAISLALKTKGCMPAVRSGLLVLNTLVSNHKGLAAQLLACDVSTVLEKCLSLSRSETMLAVIVLNHISALHQLGSKEAPSPRLVFNNRELQVLMMSLKELKAMKEVIQTIEKLLCEDGTHLEEVTHSRDIFQELVQQLEQQRSDRTVYISIIQILLKFMYKYVEDVLPWHECIEPCVSSLSSFLSDREVLQLLVQFLYQLASLNKDYAVVMSRLGTREVLLKALDKHGSGLPLAAELQDLISDCEKYAALYRKMTTSVLAGCIQMVLGLVEDHRRNHLPINIPFFDVFLRNLCQGSSVKVKEDRCWEKVEVSSNHHRANKLTDKNPKTYWESNGCTGSHFINIFMHKSVVIRQLSILVASEDSSYMPARIVVLGGDNPSNIDRELKTVNVAPSASRVVLLENMTRFWSIIQIRIKRCQQGGIDTRIRGIEVLGPKPTFWPVFKEQLCCRTFLFYRIKAQSWCQQVEEDRSQLLHLFNKLNSALRHEQTFAERFLPDAEAAQALGRTCWEALIVPIVTCITLSESSAPSPLSWLLSEYLKHCDASWRSRSRAAIFNSRVRRLTHLLVHVDTRQGESEELRPPVKSNAKEARNRDTAALSSSAQSCVKSCSSSGSSVSSIALCWQGVVQQQVKVFLDASSRLPDFVEQYVTLHRRLKNSMEELFGQQTPFLLALRQGFSAALLQLSLIQAMDVSERFAHYMDELIQASSVEWSSGSRCLERLQHFLEPLLFLSGLELASTFEHFYRYYMGDRLLTLGNTWLEASVVERIGSCFPNRFPQQMLKNLSQSSDLQQEFHLYKLQQLDYSLQDTVMEDWASSEEEADVQVLVLSPHCWAISSHCFLDKPANHFPAELCTYLEQFSEFYMHSQAMFSPDHSQPRRLQWTWLGHAELTFGSWTFQVSTLQLFLLLQFNTQQEVSVSSVLEEQRLNSAVLLHALRPLIKEGGPLTCSDPDDLTMGMLRLSQQVTSVSHEGVGKYLRLLPGQTYLDVDQDAADTLERRRSLLYCRIVLIMKQEKRLHIDNLVYKVLDWCQKHSAQDSAAGGRFGCSSGDVLSCILHVICRGCIRRNQENPHILEYLPQDPPTPSKGHAHLSFCQAPDSKEGQQVSPGPLEDAVMDGLLFSVGRTMSKDEVHQLMQRTVQQVSETLGVEWDWAEHLLVFYKWNVDLLVGRYTEDPDALLLAAGLRIRNPEAAVPAASTCPVCLSARGGATEPAPSLSCRHYCCRSCWQEYLSARIEQNLAINCKCPITDCQARPTSHFFFRVLTEREVVLKYKAALLRSYVDSCSNLTWCTNPQGCDQILCQENMSNMGTCSKCCWSSCFSCNFPEAHYPASCGHMSQWMDDGGFYEGMSAEAQSKHLAKLISKRCPSCHAQIEKNEGCLHMTCAKCNHGFCWRCLKPWKPTHKDYYNCSATTSKAARHEKKFQDFNERCTFHHLAKDFIISLEKKVSSISEALQMKNLTFVIDACKCLSQARKVLSYSCVYGFYNQDSEKVEVMEQQTDALDLHTNALQILLEETLLRCPDTATCVRLLKSEHLETGLELLRRLRERLLAILQHSTQVSHTSRPTCWQTLNHPSLLQDFGVGFQLKNSQGAGECSQSEEASNHSDTNKLAERDSDSGESCNNNNRGGEDEDGQDDDEDDYDEDYVPEWHEDYDEEEIDEDDLFSEEEEESDNMELDLSPFH
ncbi:cullin-9 isoform 2-T2 [Synchiropus picturatus]